MGEMESPSFVVPVSTTVEMSSGAEYQVDEGSIIVSTSALEGHMKALDEVQPSGRTSQFLRGKGFGWLLEVDETTDDDEKPLL